MIPVDTRGRDVDGLVEVEQCKRVGEQRIDSCITGRHCNCSHLEFSRERVLEINKSAYIYQLQWIHVCLCHLAVNTLKSRLSEFERDHARFG